jgi:hypothetical protein
MIVIIHTALTNLVEPELSFNHSKLMFHVGPHPGIVAIPGAIIFRKLEISVAFGMGRDFRWGCLLGQYFLLTGVGRIVQYSGFVAMQKIFKHHRVNEFDIAIQTKSVLLRNVSKPLSERVGCRMEPPRGCGDAVIMNDCEKYSESTQQEMHKYLPQVREFINLLHSHKGQTRFCPDSDGIQESVIDFIQRIFGFSKVRYRGLDKKTARFFVACGLVNPYMARIVQEILWHFGSIYWLNEVVA